MLILFIMTGAISRAQSRGYKNMQTSDTTYLREHQKREEDSSHLIFLLNRTVCKNFSFHVSNISKKQNVVKGGFGCKTQTFDCSWKYWL